MSHMHKCITVNKQIRPGRKNMHIQLCCTPILCLCLVSAHSKAQWDKWGLFLSLRVVMDTAAWCLILSSIVIHFLAGRTHTHTPLTQTVEEGALKTHYMDDQYCTHLRTKCVFAPSTASTMHTRAHTHTHTMLATMTDDFCQPDMCYRGNR